MRQGVNPAVRDFVRRGQRLTARLEAFPKPIITAVNGLAYGGGCEITEAVHLAVASDRARFAKPEIKLGMPPTFGGTQRLPRLAGRKRALELLLTGEDFSPECALEMGLVNHVVPHDNLIPAARDLAKRIMHHSPRRSLNHHRRNPRSQHVDIRGPAGRKRAIYPDGADRRPLGWARRLEGTTHP